MCVYIYMYQHIYEHISYEHIFYIYIHCVKSVHIRGYSGRHFLAFRLNVERYSISFHIQSKCGKMRTKITPNTDTFYAMIHLYIYVSMHIHVLYASNVNIQLPLYCVYISFMYVYVYIHIHVYII